MRKKCLLSKDQIRLWVSDLRSGEFSQTRERLHDDFGFCCLGVLAYRLGTLVAKPVDEEHVVPNKTILGCEFNLVQLNDVEKKSFAEIADWIEREILPVAPDQMVPGALDLLEDEPEDY